MGDRQGQRREIPGHRLRPRHRHRPRRLHPREHRQPRGHRRLPGLAGQHRLAEQRRADHLADPRAVHRRGELRRQPATGRLRVRQLPRRRSRGGCGGKEPERPGGHGESGAGPGGGGGQERRQRAQLHRRQRHAAPAGGRRWVERSDHRRDAHRQRDVRQRHLRSEPHRQRAGRGRVRRQHGGAVLPVPRRRRGQRRGLRRTGRHPDRDSHSDGGGPGERTPGRAVCGALEAAGDGAVAGRVRGDARRARAGGARSHRRVVRARVCPGLPRGGSGAGVRGHPPSGAATDQCPAAAAAVLGCDRHRGPGRREHDRRRPAGDRRVPESGGGGGHLVDLPGRLPARLARHHQRPPGSGRRPRRRREARGRQVAHRHRDVHQGRGGDDPGRSGDGSRGHRPAGA